MNKGRNHFGIRFLPVHGGRNAFTLIELLVVMLIIAIMSGMIVGAGIYAKGASNRARAKAEIQNLQNALVTYRIETGSYPQNLDDVRSRIPQDIQGRMDRRDRTRLLDPWNRPYVYMWSAEQPETFTLYSHGPNPDIAADNILSGK